MALDGKKARASMPVIATIQSAVHFLLVKWPPSVMYDDGCHVGAIIGKCNQMCLSS